MSKDDVRERISQGRSDSAAELSQFADTFEQFSRIINGLQRQYLQLKEEFSAQNDLLADVNRKLVDVTRRNLAATQFLHSILESIGVGVIAVDQSGRVTQFNRTASVLLGLPIRDPLGRPYRDVIPPGVPVEANCLRAIETGRTIDQMERHIDLIDGTRLHLSVSTALLRDDEGKPFGAVEVLHDLTKMKKMELEMSRLNTLAALGEMAATIAHEVRNPLAGIGGFAALLQRDLPHDDPRQKLVEKITRGVDSLNRTVTTLLNYSRYEEVNREPVPFEQFLQRTIEQYRHESGQKVARFKFDLRLPAEAGRGCTAARIDPLLMRQLFFNLFSNALEASGDQGTVKINCAILPRQAATQRYGERLLLGLDETVLETTVVDTGPGLPPEHTEKIFSPFFTTKAEGTGLGLAVAWKIIKAHGGEILADNAPGGGARFTVLVPTMIHHEDRETWS